MADSIPLLVYQFHEIVSSLFSLISFSATGTASLPMSAFMEWERTCLGKVSNTVQIVDLYWSDDGWHRLGPSSTAHTLGDARMTSQIFYEFCGVLAAMQCVSFFCPWSFWRCPHPRNGGRTPIFCLNTFQSDYRRKLKFCHSVRSLIWKVSRVHLSLLKRWWVREAVSLLHL